MTSFIWQLVQTCFKVNYRKRANGDGRFTILLGWEPSKDCGENKGSRCHLEFGNREVTSFEVRQPV